MDDQIHSLGQSLVSHNVLFLYLCAFNYLTVTPIFMFLEPLKIQLVDASIQETLCDILQRLQVSSQTEDMCTMKSSSDLIVSLLLGGK